VQQCRSGVRNPTSVGKPESDDRTNDPNTQSCQLITGRDLTPPVLSANEVTSSRCSPGRRVGYGDISPHTVPGRIIAIAVMLLGVCFLAVLTATVASHFVQVDQEEGSDEILETLHRIEADVAELKAQFALRQ
jgi:hypothetical protein